MLPIGNPAMASKYASQMVNKMAGEAKRLAPWGAPAAIFGACCVPCLDSTGLVVGLQEPPETEAAGKCGRSDRQKPSTGRARYE